MRRVSPQPIWLVGSVAVAAAVTAALGGESGPLPIAPGVDRDSSDIHTVRVRLEPRFKSGHERCRAPRREDLEVRLDGRTVPTSRLQLLDERQPRRHALLLDTSRSLVGYLDEVRATAREYVDQIDFEHDSAMLFSFDDGLRALAMESRDPRALTAEIDRICFGGGTSLTDGTVQLLSELRLLGGDSVIILITDGGASQGVVGPAELHDSLQQSRVPVFVIGLKVPGMTASDPFARVRLRDIARHSGGRYFDAPTGSRLRTAFAAIRAAIGSERTLVVADDERRGPRQLRVTTNRAGCRVSWRPDPLDPREGSPGIGPATGTPAAAALLRESLRHRRDRGDSRCAGSPDDALSARFRPDPEARGDLAACVLDLALAPTWLYEPFGRGTELIEQGTSGRPYRHRTRLPRRGLDRLPRSVVDWLPTLAATARRLPARDYRFTKEPADWHARPFIEHPNLISGTTFFDVRAALAEAFLETPDYRELLDRGLAREEQEILGRLDERLAARFPEVEPRARARIVEESGQARALRAARESPGAHDASRYLAAWLGDLPAHELFARWELSRMRERIHEGGRPGNDFAGDWRALRSYFFVPSYVTSIALLAPVLDAERSRVGYFRVLLPRPGWLDARRKGWRSHPEWGRIPFDLIPEDPHAYRFLERLLEAEPALERFLRDESELVLSELRYRSLLKPGKQVPHQAFGKAAVELVFTGENRSGRPVTIELTFSDDSGGFTMKMDSETPDAWRAHWIRACRAGSLSCSVR